MNTIKIYKRKNSNYYQMKVKVRGYSAFRRSTGETNQHKAQQIAEDFLQDKLVDKKAGKNLCTCKFDTLAGAFTKHLKEQLQTKEINLMVYKLNVYAIHNYLLPFFKEKDINTINRAVIEQYVDYRKQNSRNGKVPNNDTVNRSIIIFKNIFKHAFKKGLIGESQLIQFKLLPVKTNRRPAFSEKDLDIIWDCFDNFVAESPSASTKKYREDLRDLCIILRYTGCRPHEILADKRLGHRGLRWCDVEQFKKDSVILHVTGKTCKREVIAPQQVKMSLDRMYSCTRKLTPNDTVFYGTYKRQFKNLLLYSGVICDAQGNNFSMYSFRHSYATLHLLNGVSEHLLAKNMGTSSKMLDNHYSHVKPRMAYKQLLLK